MSIQRMKSGSIRSEIKWDTSDLTRFTDWVYPDILEGSAQEASKDAAREGVKAGRRKIWVDTHSAQRSGRTYTYKSGQYASEVGIRFGGYITNPKTGRKVDYAGYIEKAQSRKEGESYMEYAIKVAEKFLPKRYKQIVDEKLKMQYGWR